MPASPDLWLYFIIVAGVVVLPGMDMAFVAGSALAAGRRAGLLAVAGVMLGGAVHMAVGATGIAALVTWFPAVFNGLLLAGAAYVAWIGWTLLRSAPSTGLDVAAVATPRRGAGVFWQAAATCLLNPKAYAFMFAVFPAFIHDPRRPLPLQALLLAAITAATQAGVYGTVALAAAATRDRLQGDGRMQRWLPRAVGLLLIGAAALTLAGGWRGDAPAARPGPVEQSP